MSATTVELLVPLILAGVCLVVFAIHFHRVLRAQKATWEAQDRSIREGNLLLAGALLASISDEKMRTQLWETINVELSNSEWWALMDGFAYASLPSSREGVATTDL